MKHLTATATRRVAAPIDDAYALLVDIDGYPRWYPAGVASAAVTARDSNEVPTAARASLNGRLGPINRTFDLNLSVSVQRPESVELSRIAHDAGDSERFVVRWRLRPEEGGTRIAVEFDALLSIPPLVPVGGIADTIAAGFADAAAQALES